MMFIVGLALGIIATPLAAEAQQPGKVLQTGVSGNSPASQIRIIKATRYDLVDFGMFAGFDGCQTERIPGWEVRKMTPAVLDRTKGMGEAV